MILLVLDFFTALSGWLFESNNSLGEKWAQTNHIGVGSGVGGDNIQVGWASPPPPTLPMATAYIVKYIVDIIPHLCPLTGEGNHIKFFV